MVFIITYIITGIIGWLITNAVGIILIGVANIEIDWKELFRGYALWMTLGIIAWAILWPLTALSVVCCVVSDKDNHQINLKGVRVPTGTLPFNHGGEL